MKPYEWWVTSFAYTISYAVMVWPVILLLMWRGSIPPESRRIALWKIAAVAGMGQVSDLFGFFPTSHLGGALQVRWCWRHAPSRQPGWQSAQAWAWLTTGLCAPSRRSLGPTFQRQW